MSQPTDKRKQSLYFPEDMLLQIQGEATRLDRSLSWIVQQAWKTARSQIAKMPGMNELGPTAPVSASADPAPTAKA
jgi:uncharacterized small protein (TIGR04563 family)